MRSPRPVPRPLPPPGHRAPVANGQAMESATIRQGPGAGYLPHPSLLKPVREASYLTAENAHRYRPIMRFFYERHMAHRYWLTAEAVLAHVRDHFDPAYTEAQCEQDLAALVAWGDLWAEQERARAHTIEEFLRKQLRYQLTPYGIAFERLLTELEQAQGARGSLDPTLLDNLWARLDALRRLLPETDPATAPVARLRQVRSLWTEANAYFVRLVADANDYLAALHRARPGETRAVEDFVAYKDVLVQYLTTFVNQLLDCAERVRALLAAWREATAAERLLLLLVGFDTAHVPGPDGRLPEAADVRALYQDQYQALEDWFRRGGGVEVLRRVTAEAISLVIRQTQRLVDRRQMGLGRARDLERLAQAFAGCATLGDAHRLAAAALGCTLPRHLLGSREQFTLAESGSVWGQEPQPVPLARVRRGPRGRGTPAPVRDRRAEQAEVLRQEAERRQREAAVWDELFRAGPLDVGRLTVADPAVRDRVLDALGRCLAAPDGTAVALDGSPLRLAPPRPGEGYGRLRAPDGVLALPPFRLQRDEAAR
jgi:uncharacterized protein (TIGR02677 family)